MRNRDVAAFEMRKAHQRLPVAQHPGPDPGADGGIGQRPAALPCALVPFAERRAVDIGIDRDRYAEPAQRIMKPAPAQPGLGVVVKVP